MSSLKKKIFDDLPSYEKNSESLQKNFDNIMVINLI